MTRRLILACSIAWTLAFDAAPAAAQSLQACQTTVIPSQTAGSTALFSVPLFDAGQGSLAGVQVTINATATGSLRIESAAPTPVVVNAVFSAGITLHRPNNSLISLAAPSASFIDSLAGFDGVLDFGGTSGITHPGITASTSSTITLATAADLALFSGPAGVPGSIQLRASVLGNSSATGGGNLTFSSTASCGASVDICYLYSPQFADAVSRGVSVSAELTPAPSFDDAVSRAVSVATAITPSVTFDDAISRAVCISAGLTPVPVFDDSVSREVSVVTPTPDIAVVSVATPPAGDTGTNFVLQWTIANVGGVTATGTWTEKVYRSDDTIFGDADDVLVGTFTLAGPLAPGAFAARGQTITYGPSAGVRYFAVQINGGVGYAEEDTSDNVAFSGLVTVHDANIQKPDLVVDPFSLPTSPSPLSGAQLSFTYHVRNSGAVATNVSHWLDEVRLQSGPTSHWLTTIANPSYLGIGTSYDVPVTVTLPENVTGAWSITVKTDAGNALVESNENNNSAASNAFTITLGPQPDLVAENVSVDTGGTSDAFAGQLVTVHWRDRNQGAAPTDTHNWTDHIYLSTNAQPSVANDILLASSSASLPAPLLGGAPAVAFSTIVELTRERRGVHYLKVLADANGDVSEDAAGTETNNVAVSAAFNVKLGQTPDLEAVAVRRLGTGPALAGHSILVEWEVRDLGGATWHRGFSWNDRLYLSSDDTLQTGAGGDLVLGTFRQTAAPFGALGSGDWSGTNYWRDPSAPAVGSPNSGPKTGTVTLPNSLPAGDWYLFVAVDADHELPERRAQHDAELNNVAVSTTSTSTPTPEPIGVQVLATDLVISPGVVAPSAHAGDPLALSFTVRNQGAAATPVASWVDRVYLSNDAQLSPNDPVIATIAHHGTLSAGASYIVNATGLVPLATPGAYRLIFVTDDADPGFSDGRVWELGAEGNNTAVLQLGSDPFVVQPGAADLVVDEPILVPSIAAAGEVLPVAWTVSNVGALATNAVAWTDRVYLSLDASIGSSDVLLGEFTHGGALAASASYSASASFTIPPGPGGLYYVIVQTDAAHQVFETSESNNARYKRMRIDVAQSAPANLVIVRPTGPPAVTVPVVAPATAVSGQPLELRWGAKNTGTGATNVERWNDVVYLSIDTFFDPSVDRYVGTFEHQAFLGAGEQRDVTATFDVPLGVSGPRYVIVVTDATGDVYEGSQETDNVANAPAPTEFTLPAPCDLRFTDLQFGASGTIGFRLPLTWTIANEGATSSPASWTDNFYLSDDAVLSANDLLIGQVTDSGVLAPGGVRTQSRSLGLPGVPPGNYHVLAFCDARNQVPEGANENDNIHVSLATVALSAIPIAPGGTSIQSTPNGSSRYFELVVPPGASRTLRVTLTHDSPNAWTELYASRGDIPHPGDSDFTFTAPGASHQEFTLTEAQGDTFYILARATSGVGQLSPNAVLRVVDQPFEIGAVAPARVGRGRVTIELTGGRLDELVSVFLRPSGGVASLAATELRVVDSAHALARFDLDASLAGVYDVGIVDGTGNVFVASSALEIEAPRPLVAGFELALAPNIRKGAHGSGTASIANRGNVDVTRAVLVVGARTDPNVSIGVPASGASTLESDGVGETLVLFTEGLGPTQLAAIEIAPRIGKQFTGDSLPMAVTGVVLDDATWFGTLLPAIAEELRVAVLADASSTAGLRARAATSSAWLAEIVASPPPPFGGIFDPEAAPRLGREVVRTVADAATSGLPANDRVPEAALARSTAALGCAVLGGAQLDCAALRPSACDGGLATVVATVAEGANTPVEIACCDTPTSDDPNDKARPRGHGAQNQVSANAPVRYRVYFENVSDAAAPAAVVQIEDVLEPTLDAASFRATRIVFGNTDIDLGATGLLTCQRTIDLSSTHGVVLRITSGVEAANHKVFWRLESVDPVSGLAITDGLRGFLPPDDGHGSGAGHVEFLVNPNRPVVVTGTTAGNSATIVFDSNAPIHTRRVVNTFDADRPTTDVGAFPSGSSPFAARLEWTGSDPIGGAGLDDVTIYASRDDGPFVPIVTDTRTSSLEFHGVPGSTYRFHSRGRDRTGNVELAPEVSDTLFVVPSDCNHNGVPDSNDIVVHTSSDCDGNLVPDECDTDTDGDGTADACDGCPFDATKTEPGVCGCGVPDTGNDVDADGVVDCIDNCPAIANTEQLDCDGDAIGDVCEIAAGARDCNVNLTPDDCDLASGTSADADSDAAPDECEGGPGTSFCSGDGVEALVTTNCPCGNTGAIGHGCRNSIAATGAFLYGAGTTAPDTLVLAASGMPPNSFAIYAKSDLWSPAGFVHGDGVSCLAGSIVRFATKHNSGGASAYPEANDAPLSQRSLVLPGSGETAYYQVFYRNAAATFCTTATTNTTNAWQIVW